MNNANKCQFGLLRITSSEAIGCRVFHSCAFVCARGQYRGDYKVDRLPLNLWLSAFEWTESPSYAGFSVFMLTYAINAPETSLTVIDNERYWIITLSRPECDLLCCCLDRGLVRTGLYCRHDLSVWRIKRGTRCQWWQVIAKTLLRSIYPTIW